MKIVLTSSIESQTPRTVAKALQKADDDLSIAPVFSTDIKMKHKVTDDMLYYMSNEEVELSYKNNAFMWVRSTPNGSIGVTKPDMYDSKVFVMSFADFNNMSGPVLEELINDEGCVICFIDTKAKRDKDEIRESQFALERVFTMNNYLYFLDDPDNFIVDTILKYIGSDELERKNIADSLNS